MTVSDGPLDAVGLDVAPAENRPRHCSSDTVEPPQNRPSIRKQFLTGKCLIQVIDGDIVKAIQLNHRKILDVHTISVAVWKVTVIKSDKPFAGCFSPPAGVGADTGDGADRPATKLAAS